MGGEPHVAFAVLEDLLHIVGWKSVVGACKACTVWAVSGGCGSVCLKEQAQCHQEYGYEFTVR